MFSQQLRRFIEHSGRNVTNTFIFKQDLKAITKLIKLIKNKDKIEKIRSLYLDCVFSFDKKVFDDYIENNYFNYYFDEESEEIFLRVKYENFK